MQGSAAHFLDNNQVEHNLDLRFQKIGSGFLQIESIFRARSGEFQLARFAGSYCEPVIQGMSVHADNCPEFGGLRLQVT